MNEYCNNVIIFYEWVCIFAEKTEGTHWNVRIFITKFTHKHSKHVCETKPKCSKPETIKTVINLTIKCRKNVNNKIK